MWSSHVTYYFYVVTDICSNRNTLNCLLTIVKEWIVGKNISVTSAKTIEFPRLQAKDRSKINKRRSSNDSHIAAVDSRFINFVSSFSLVAVVNSRWPARQNLIGQFTHPVIWSMIPSLSTIGILPSPWLFCVTFFLIISLVMYALQFDNSLRR